VGDSALPVEVKLFDDLAEAERDAAGALGRAARLSLFDRIAWYRLIATHCPPPGRLLVARARGNGEASWLFLSVERGRARALAAWYSLRFALAGDPGGAEAIARALGRQRLASVALAPLENPASLTDAFRKAGWLTFIEPATFSWQINTQDTDFDTYWAARPSRLRNTAERKARAAGLDVAIHRRFDDSAWSDYESVYRTSWKPEEGSPAFLRALAEQEGAAGTLRLGIASKDGSAVAAQLWLVENGRATIHKLAYSEAARDLSPGTVLSMAMFRHVLDEDRVSRIDYGTGDDAYKRDWMEERATLWRLAAFNPRTVRGLAGAARAAASALVRRARSR